jgi:hypothetical protein
MLQRTLSLALVAALLSACVGTTGGGLVSFKAAGAGPKDAVKGAGLTFPVTVQGKTFTVTLTRAKVHVQAIYLNRVRQSGTQREDGCYQASSYVGEVRSDVDIDALDPAPQYFPQGGSALADRALAADLWLGAGPIDDYSQESARTVVFDAAGTAQSSAGGDAIPFSAAFKIDLNRRRAPRSATYPGTNLICQLRIVDQIAVDVLPAEGGTLVLRVDPRGWFLGTDFDELKKGGGAPPYAFPDEAKGVSVGVFDNMRRNAGVYTFEFAR